MTLSLRLRRCCCGGEPGPTLIPCLGGAPFLRRLGAAPSISGPPGRPCCERPGVCRPQRRAASTPFPGRVARPGFKHPAGHEQPRGLRGLAPGQHHSPRFTALLGAASCGSGKRGSWEGEARTRRGRRGEEREAPRHTPEEGASHRALGRSGEKAASRRPLCRAPARTWGCRGAFSFLFL